MTSKLKTDVLETVSGSGTIALTNQLTGMTSASVPAGSVIQVISATNTNTAAGGFLLTTTSSSYVSVPLAVSITPSSTSSKIMILVNTATYRAATGYLTLYRGSTNISGTNGLANPSGSSSSRHEPVSISYLDSPNTASSVQYTLYARTASGTLYVGGDGDLINSITVIEIKG
tara:strand:+ start:3141 stop:3659 length:519 start_codon:yes stop_codon:yes gene_type:complete